MGPACCSRGDCNRRLAASSRARGCLARDARATGPLEREPGASCVWIALSCASSRASLWRSRGSTTRGQRAAFGEVVRDAAIDQPAERSIAARADDQNVEVLTELCALLARLANGWPLARHLPVPRSPTKFVVHQLRGQARPVLRDRLAVWDAFGSETTDRTLILDPCRRASSRAAASARSLSGEPS